MFVKKTFTVRTLVAILNIDTSNKQKSNQGEKSIINIQKCNQNSSL
jgi:hypothetical protein